MSESLSAEQLILAYARGIFPMAMPDECDAVYWFSPDPRGVIPLDACRIPRSVGRAVRRSTFTTSTDEAFEAVIRKCSDRSETWISDQLVHLYTELFRRGHAHSIETWLDSRLVGGLYGVCLGGAFFAESMYHDESDASNVALVDLMGRLQASGHVLLDTQYLTSHLERFGAVEVSREAFLSQLENALRISPEWKVDPGPQRPSTLSH